MTFRTRCIQLGVIVGMGIAGLTTNPSPAAAQLLCTQCRSNCPLYPDAFCISIACPPNAATCSFAVVQCGSPDMPYKMVCSGAGGGGGGGEE